MSNLLTALGVLIGGIIGGLTPFILKWLNNLPTEKSLQKGFDRDDAINSFIYGLRKELNADYVSIIDYIPKKKRSNKPGAATMNYESAKPGKKKLQPQFQNVPTSPISAMLGSLQRVGQVKVDVNSDPVIKEVHDELGGIITSYKFRLYDLISKGNLVVAFCEEKTLTEKEFELIDNAIALIKPHYK